jgi:hypothetical protein
MGVAFGQNIYGVTRFVDTRTEYPINSPPEGAHSPESAPASRLTSCHGTDAAEILPYDGRTSAASPS